MISYMFEKNCGPGSGPRAEGVRETEANKRFDRLIQLIAALVLTGLAVALLLAVREGLLPTGDDDVYDTVYAYQEPEPGEREQ